MGLQMDYDENGKTIWEYKDPSIEGGSLLWIIDECSMINNQLYENIIKFHKNRHTLKIIFVGDRYQLPPVNESMSKTFDYSNTNQYALMKKIVRNDGTIVDCCKQIRKSQREFVSTGYFAPIDFKYSTISLLSLSLAILSGVCPSAFLIEFVILLFIVILL